MSQHEHNPTREQYEDTCLMMMVTFWISLFQQGKEVECESISTQQLKITRNKYIYY
jgi:hypothetical protein